jgi:hypothetical protein
MSALFSYRSLEAFTLPIRAMISALMSVTGFAGTADYSETATDCMTTAVGINGTCSLTVTFNPGPGDDAGNGQRLSDE